MNTYVLHVTTGSELDVVKSLQEHDYDAFVPIEECMERRRGSWHFRDKILIPGYVFVRMVINDTSYYEIKDIPGVIRFLGAKAPIPIREDEEEKLLSLLDDNKRMEVSRIITSEDGTFRVLEGALIGREKDIIKLDRHRRKAHVKFKLGTETSIVTLSAIII